MIKTFPMTVWSKPPRYLYKGTDEEWNSLRFEDIEGKVGVEFRERGTIFGLMDFFRDEMTHMAYYADELIADIESGTFIEKDMFFFDTGQTRPALAAKTEDIVVAFKEFGLV